MAVVVVARKGEIPAALTAPRAAKVTLKETVESTPYVYSVHTFFPFSDHSFLLFTNRTQIPGFIKCPNDDLSQHTYDRDFLSPLFRPN